MSVNEKSIALGTFDGLHKGHLQVILQSENDKYDRMFCFLTFIRCR